MASDASRAAHQGLLILDPRLQSPTSIWAAQSSYSQVGASPSSPVPTTSSWLILQASGSLTTDDTVEVLSLQSGMAEPGGGSFVWRKGADTLYHGWDPPMLLTGWEAVTWSDGSTGDVRATSDPHAVTLRDGTVVAVMYRRYVPLLVNNYQVAAYVRNPSTGQWTDSVVYTTTTSPAPMGFHPCLVVLPNERILCYYLSEDTVNEETQIRMSYSDDQGATWVLGSAGVLKTPMDTNTTVTSGGVGGRPGRLRGAYLNGQVLLVAEFKSNNSDPLASNSYDRFIQFASDDLGCRFDTIGEEWDGVTTPAGNGWGRYQEILAVGGVFQMYYIEGSMGRPRRLVIGSAFDSLANAPAASSVIGGIWSVNDASTPASVTDGDLAVWLDDDGTIYMALRAADDLNECTVTRSRDYGETWQTLGISDYTASSADIGTWWDAEDAATYPTGFCATRQGGRAIVLHNWAANPGNEDNSMGAAYLGGYSTVTMPHYATPRSDATQVTWLLTGLPFDLPEDTGWTAVGAGTSALGSGHLGFTTLANTRYYQNAPTSTEDEGIIARFAFAFDDVGGSLGTNEVAVTLRLADGTNDRQVDIRFEYDGADLSIRARDANGATNIGSDAVITGSSSVDIIAAIRGGNFSLFYRGYSLVGPRTYAVGPSTTSLTNDTTSPSASNLVRWGHLANTTADTRWWEWHFTCGSYTGSDLAPFAEGQTNPDDLFARAFSPTPTWVDSGLYLRANDGPTMANESWSIAPTYSYGINRIFPTVSASPRVKWRSTDTTQQTIALAFDPSLLGTAESNLLSTAIGLSVVGSNWRTGTWQGYDVDTAAWVTIATIDAAEGFTSLDYSRQGNTIVPAVGAVSDEPYLHFNECQGWIFSYDGSTFRRITTNTEGNWPRSNDVTKKATLVLADVGSGDPTGGTGAVIIPTSFTIVAYTAARYAGYRLVIDAQTTPEGYFEIGAMVMGPVVVFGKAPDRDRSISLETGAELTVERDRTTRSRVAAPPQRTVRLGWSDGLDLTKVEDKDPDYILATTTSSVAPVAAKDTTYQIEGLLGWLDGEHRHVVYLPRLPQGPSDTVMCNRRRNHVYGRVTGAWRVETVLGEECSTEVVRGGELLITEDV